MIKSTDINQINLAKEMVLLDNTNTIFSSLLLNKGVEPAHSTIVQWQLENLDTTDGLALEGSDVSKFQATKRRTEKNVMQIIAKAVNLSRTSQQVFGEGIADLKAREIQNRMLEVKRDLERYLISGVYNETETSAKPRQMKGLKNFVETANKVESTKITIDDLNAMAKLMRKNGTASQEMVLLCGYDVIDEVQKMFAQNVRYVETNDFGHKVSRLQLTHGSAIVYTVDGLEPDECLLVNLDYLKIAELSPLTVEELGKTGDNDKYLLTVENTLKVLNTNAITHYKKKAA